MFRLPYEKVIIEADYLSDKVLLCSEWEEMDCYLQYLLFVSAVGWTELELDKETLKRIDMGWDVNLLN